MEKIINNIKNLSVVEEYMVLNYEPNPFAEPSEEELFYLLLEDKELCEGNDIEPIPHFNIQSQRFEMLEFYGLTS